MKARTPSQNKSTHSAPFSVARARRRGARQSPRPVQLRVPVLAVLALARPTASAPTGRLDALIRGLADAASKGTTKEPISKTSAEGWFADILNQSFQNYGEPNISPTPQQDTAAGLMFRAMLQPRSDGRIDDGEKKKIP